MPQDENATPLEGGGGGSGDDEDLGEDDESDYEGTPYGEDTGEKGCYDCNSAVRPSSGRCTHCFKLNYICPDTGQCFAPGDWVWHRGSSWRPGFKASREAAKEDVFQLLYRMTNDTLDRELFEQEWNYYVGNDCYADERAFPGCRLEDPQAIKFCFRD